MRGIVNMENILVALVHGIVLGGAYGSIALGLSMVFGVTRIVNYAHGSMLMVSTFAYFGLWELFGIDPYLGIIIVAPLMYTFAYMIMKVLIRPLILRERASVISPLSVLLLTVGIWIALDNLFMMLFGSTYRTMNTPANNKYFEIGDALFVTQYSKIIAFFGSILIAAALWFILNKTEIGLRIRSVSQNRDAAAICGVDVYKTYNVAFGLGAGTVSIAGALLSQFFFVQPQIGATFGTKSFMIVVLGGLGSIPGALIGGLIFGIVETLGAQFITSTSASMLSFLLFIVVLFFRPKGLMGKIKL